MQAPKTSRSYSVRRSFIRGQEGRIILSYQNVNKGKYILWLLHAVDRLANLGLRDGRTTISQLPVTLCHSCGK